MNKNNFVEEKISKTLEKNYLPYAMSVIFSRALPEIDGFKPSHRKLLYTMYKMNLIKGNKTKSANVVGQTMKLNPHGEGAIYSTLVRLSRSNESLLYPYIESKGNFGKVYSRDMAFAASRYTEVKLESICETIFNEIEKGTVEFEDNYDGTMYEPKLLPVMFPSILVNPNKGIAVGMASNICSFNLQEIVKATIALLKNPKAKLSMIKGADFPTGGNIIKDKKILNKIIEEGRGTFKIQAVYNIIEKQRRVEITQIPYTTTIEAIIDRIISLVKQGELKEISDIRDESDLKGLRITIDFKKGTDINESMRFLLKNTTLTDSFSCNFNMIMNSYPKVLGVREILLYWIDFRMGCIRNALRYDISNNKKKLHLLEGLKKIILDIDRAIKLIRKTKKETGVIPALMQEFKIDKEQAEFIANIRLRNINEEYLQKQIDESIKLSDEVKRMESEYNDDNKIHIRITNELNSITKKYSHKRKSGLIDEVIYEEKEEKEEIHQKAIILTDQHYVKKLNVEQKHLLEQHKLKEGDEIHHKGVFLSNDEVLLFSDKFNVYKVLIDEIEETRINDLGIYLPSIIDIEKDENIIYSCITSKFEGYLLFAFENGNVAKIPAKSYKTKHKRGKLVKAYNEDLKLVNIAYIEKDTDVLFSRYASQKEAYLLVNSSLISPKSTRSARGVKVQRVTKRGYLTSMEVLSKSMADKMEKYRGLKIPLSGKTRKTFE